MFCSVIRGRRMTHPGTSTTFTKDGQTNLEQVRLSVDEPVVDELKATLKIHCPKELFFLIGIVIGVLLGKFLLPSCPSVTPLCLQDWVGYNRRCYFFSDDEGTWDTAQSNCSFHGASLAVIDTQKEKDFLLQHKGASDYWFGLRRIDEQPWKWTNGSDFNNWFPIGANGPCAYLNDEAASSTWCDTERNWICSRPDHIS
ncbi:C-type lectin domain family 2 member B-like isoform X2 [Varanus komodoensis]|uniref:C-type lectin domain-containing protein n=1 Tax=Varanus komodoensis TaxID=61221 RepID=A0A8D2J6V4_VARKO|nr:C-type lectin domain family 2 member B-like isoform X2 [Varanus komodoensis]